MLIYGACKDIKHRLVHFRSKYTGEPVLLDSIAASATFVTFVASAAVTTIFVLPSMDSTKFFSSNVSGSWNFLRGTMVASAWSILISCVKKSPVMMPSVHTALKVLASTRKYDMGRAPKEKYRRINVVHRCIIYYPYVCDMRRHPVFPVELDHHWIAIHLSLYELASVANSWVKPLDVARR